MKMKFKKLWREVCDMHNSGAYHIKRGFSLKDSTSFTASNHLIEETVELQAEVVCADGCKQFSQTKALEEAADVLLVFLHLLKVSNLNIYTVLKFARDKLKRNFTLDKSKILTNTPGFNRSNRNESLQRGLEQAKNRQFSKNPPNIDNDLNSAIPT